MKKIVLMLTMALISVSSSRLASDYTMAPGGSYVGGDSYTMTPDGSYVGGRVYITAPDGSYVGK